jgi:hypothetical protein
VTYNFSVLDEEPSTWRDFSSFLWCRLLEVLLSVPVSPVRVAVPLAEPVAVLLDEALDELLAELLAEPVAVPDVVSPVRETVPPGRGLGTSPSSARGFFFFFSLASVCGCALDVVS